MAKYLDLSFIDAKDFLISIGINNISSSGGEITFSCPSSDHLHGDSRPSARMNIETTAFICQGCGWRGNAISFLSKHKSIPDTVAQRLLEERYGGDLISPIGDLTTEVEKIMSQEKSNIKEKRITPSEEWIDKFYLDWYNPNWCQGCHPNAELYKDLIFTHHCSGCNEQPEYKKYMYDRGFTMKILQSWDIGYDEISQRITIPIRDHLGKLVGFKGRTCKKNENIKYLVLGDTDLSKSKYGFQTYKKSEFVFGLDRAIEDHYIKCILIEGELNVIAMDQKGYNNVIGIAGSEFSEIQRDLIKEYCTEVIIFFDNDKAGRGGTKKVVEMLSPYMPLRVVQNALGDAADLTKEQIDDLISGAESALLLQARGEL